jgi:hypothetical protein
MATTARLRTPAPHDNPATSEEACGRYVFCAGMPRSGSTWQYQIVSHLLEAHRGGVRGGFLERPEDFARMAEQTAGRAPWLTLKTHNGYPAYAEALRDGRAAAVYSYRDLRDVTFSLMHKMRLPFEEIVGRLQLVQCLNDHTFWTAQPNVLCQRYERIVSDPAACVVEVADFLGLRLADGEAERLAAAYSLEANRARARELARRLREKGVDLDGADNAALHDEHSQLHWNHIRAGRVGGWRDEATPEQLAVLAKECGVWLIENGYERDLTWAMPAMQHLCGALEASQRELRAEREGHAKALHELMALKQFGSFALTVARGLHRVAGWTPRLAGAVKRLLRGAGVGKDPALLAACREDSLSEAGGGQ